MTTKDRIPAPAHNPFLPNDSTAPGVPQRPQLKWSHFKPEYAGKPEEDTGSTLI